jgi:hypothetical protein
VLAENGIRYETDQDKANIFANLLSHTFTNTQPTEPKTLRLVENEINKLNTNNGQEFPMFQFNEAKSILLSLNVNKAAGEDAIQNTLLKKLPNKFIPILVHLANCSVKTATLPQEWKEAVVTMIPKKDGYSPNPTLYRPISLTSCIGKFVERLIKIRLTSFLEEKKILVVQQSGFRTNRSTHDNLIFLTQKAIEQINRSKKLIAFFFDIEKAFDKVWHKAVLGKMARLNIPVYLINWVKAFLSNRSFKVKVNNSYSAEFPILAGVPQGSAISPVLFSIFINDMPLMDNLNLAYSLLFADDLVSFFCFDREGKLKSKVENYLKSIEKWVTKWRLKMAASKCCYTVFASMPYQLNFKPKLFGVAIPNDKNPKFLGVKFDERLTFSTHIALK